MARDRQQHKVATQMGTQGMADDGARAGVEVIRSGVLGDGPRDARVDRPRQGLVAAGRRPARRTRRRSPRSSTGTCGSAWRPSGRIIPTTCRSSGAAGRISAPGRSATWASTTRPCRMWAELGLPESVEIVDDVGAQSGDVPGVVDPAL